MLGLVGVVGMLAAAAAGAGPATAPPKVDYPLLAAPVRPASGTADVSIVDAGGAKVLRMPCTFRGTKIDRALWDWDLQADLTTCRGVRVAIYCSDPSVVSSFTLYLRSGKGWYNLGFQLHQPGWTTVTLNKSKARIEGKPDGWEAIRGIRLSAWRGRDVDTDLYLAGIGRWGGGEVMLVRGDTNRRESEAKSIVKYAAEMADRLDAMGVDFGVVNERDVTAARLAQTKVVVLPHSPSMSPGTTDVLVAFLARGGKMVSFYSLPTKLRRAMGIGGGGHVNRKTPGDFASIRPVEGVVDGFPGEVLQASWNLSETTPLPGRSRVAAWWHDGKGERTNHAAVVVSDNAIHMSHVMLADDEAAKRRMLLAMLGHFLPACWQGAVDRDVAGIGRFGLYETFEQARKDILATAAGDPRGTQACKEAAALRDEAQKLARAGKFADALSRAQAARERMLRAYCVVQKPQTGEHRAFWCHRASGVSGMTWDEAIAHLAANGFTAILPNMLWGGSAFYNSDVLPWARGAEDDGDQIAACLAACKKYGIECHVWKVNWNMGWSAPKDFAAKMKAGRRTQVRFDGKREDRWLCPSHPANRKQEIEAMVEVARKYDVHGVHFDYIRYPNSDGCFCGGCRERFQNVLGRKVADWPAEVRRDEKVHAKWVQWRRDNITAVVAAVAAGARRARPGVKISAAVFSNWPRDRDRIGQDWKLWCEKGYLDFVCPMDYSYAGQGFEDIVRRQMEWAGGVPVYPGIGLSVWDPPNDVVKMIDQIRTTRRLQTGGFTVFNYAATQARDVLPLLGQGITRKHAAVP